LCSLSKGKKKKKKGRNLWARKILDLVMISGKKLEQLAIKTPKVGRVYIDRTTKEASEKLGINPPK